ncbi:extracellular solute-binding protein [Desulfosediminicola flagellatus]|uniref:extracellular solute-binding protein n=1 Tax=Desulfosediminicola flagellatus TaxID=2569541 RepID=UPI0010ABF16A|nr:extracellular solute-binding protein [Desulfosediminicola flagellatus]
MNIFTRFMVVLIVLLVTTNSWAAHGISVNSELKYKEGFTHFEYASPKAKKGGHLVLYSLGSFDKLNPFTLKGVAPFGLEAFVFETLGVRSMDEPTAEYGLIAKDITVADDLLSVVFTLNTDARFSDGTPVTVEDIAFSLETLKGPKVHPIYQYYYGDISHSEIIDSTRIRLVFKQPNRELAMISAQIPVFSKRSFTDDKIDSSVKTGPLGSGPYVVSNVVQGRSITYTRNKQYWAIDHPVRTGLYNYDKITIKYYKDQIVALEAFKAGEFDAMAVYIAKQWARDMDGPRFNSGELVKKIFPHSNNAGMQGFLMNTRKEIFSNRKVRQAIGLALDFEWTNKSLFFDQYTRISSYFSNSYLAATGLPEGLELEYLEELRGKVPPEVFDTPLKAPETTGKGGLRANLRKAKKLLAEAGYTVKDGILVDTKGKQLRFEILLNQATFERVMAPFASNLEKLGIQANYRTIDKTLYSDRLKTFDFDMTVVTFPQSLSPGNEQRNFWHSQSADIHGSDNYAGIKSEAVDQLVDKIIYAESAEALVAATKALDRVLWYGYYVVPNWYVSGHRIAYHDKFSSPEVLPKYYSPTDLLMTWWID